MGEDRNAQFLERSGAEDEFLRCVGKNDKAYRPPTRLRYGGAHIQAVTIGGPRVDDNDSVGANDET